MTAPTGKLIDKAIADADMRLVSKGEKGVSSGYQSCMGYVLAV
jgi:hypothetical protein